MILAIPTYDGVDPKEFDEWIERLETVAHISGRITQELALEKSSGAVTQVINSIAPECQWSEYREELRRCFSESKTRVHATMRYRQIRKQAIGENLRSYVHRYIKLHREATSLPVVEDFDVDNKVHFLSKVRNSTIALKVAQSDDFRKYDKFSLGHCIERALYLEERYQVREVIHLARDEEEEKPAVMNIGIEGTENSQEFSINVLPQDPKPTNPPQRQNTQKLICYKCGGPGHYSSQCTEEDSQLNQLYDRICGTIKHTMEAYTPVNLPLMQEMIKKSAALNNSRKANRKLVQKYREQGNQGQTQPKQPVAGASYQSQQTQQVTQPQTTNPPVVPQRGRGRGSPRGVRGTRGGTRGGKTRNPPPQAAPAPQTQQASTAQPIVIQPQIKVPANLVPSTLTVDPPTHLPTINLVAEEIPEEEMDDWTIEELEAYTDEMERELEGEDEESLENAQVEETQ